MKIRTIGEIVLSPRRLQVQYKYISFKTGEKIDGKVVSVLTITDDVIQRVETLVKTQQQIFRASRMLQYKWIAGHDVADVDANLGVPNDDENLLVPNPVEQQHIVQDPNPFSILSYDEDSKNKDGEAQQVLHDHIKNQGSEDAINTKQNDFGPNLEDQGAPQEYQGEPQKVQGDPQQVQGAQKDHGN